ncbi:MAG: hypothetical protein JWM80_5482 [Cyanobacteria bacterium RYN_339]|nr:hypothetical protein [Cyanobacteria bacterium RYN_339]
MQQVRVRVGQSLSTIALRYNTTVDAIMAANPTIQNKDMIHIGDRLDIPGRDDRIAHVRNVPLPIPRPTDIDGPKPVSPARPPVAPTAPTAPRNLANLSEADIQALTRAVAAEARGESPAVWEAVAQTIINYSRQTGMSIPRLVRTSYLSSNFDGNRHFYTMAMGRIPNHDAIRRAVLGAADYKSPVGRRSHFYDTSIGMPSWGDRHSRVQVGHVVFLNSK